MYNLESLKDVPVGTIVTVDVGGTPVTVSVELVPDERAPICEKCVYGYHCIIATEEEFFKMRPGCFPSQRKDEESVYFPKKE